MWAVQTKKQLVANINVDTGNVVDGDGVNVMGVGRVIIICVVVEIINVRAANNVCIVAVNNRRADNNVHVVNFIVSDFHAINLRIVNIVVPAVQ